MVWPLSVPGEHQESQSLDGEDYLLPRKEKGKLAPHQLIDCLDLQALARAHRATVITSLEELQTLRERHPHLQRLDIKGAIRSLFDEGFSLGHLITVTARQVGQQARNVIQGSFDFNLFDWDLAERPRSNLRHVRGQPNGMRVLYAPGWLAFNEHMSDSLVGVDVPVDVHPAYDRPALNRDVMSTARNFATDIVRDGIPTIINGHSQGAQVALNAATLLGKAGQGHLVAGLVLVAPASAGPAPWVQTAIRKVGRHLAPNLESMLGGSETIEGWQRELDDGIRKRTIVIQYAGVGGDGMTTAENSFVPGGVLLGLEETFPHESAVRHPKNPAAKLSRAVIGAMNTAYRKHSLAA